MTITKESIVKVLQPVIEKWKLKRFDYGNRNITFSREELSRLISIVQHDLNNIVIIIRDNPGIFSQQFAEDYILPLLVINNIHFDTIGYQQWSGKIVYRIISESFMDIVKTK